MSDQISDHTADEKDGAAPAGPAEIERDIERTRAELGETVEALTAKLDVKAQAKQKAGAAKDSAQRGVAKAKSSGQQAYDDKPQAVIAAGVAAVGAVAAAVVTGIKKR